MKQLPSNHDLWIVSDCSGIPEAKEQARRASITDRLASLAATLRLPAPRLWMERISTFEHGEEKYPLQPSRHHPSWVKMRNMGWWLHEPFITAIWLHPDVAKHKYTFGWFLEDDVAFAGNITPFYETMEARHPHLVSAVFSTNRKESAISPTTATEDLVWCRMCRVNSGDSWKHEKADLASTAPNHEVTVVKLNEHVTGYSDRLLKEIDGLLRKGVYEYGEMFSATVCYNQPSWCSIEDMYATNFVTKPFWGMFSYWTCHHHEWLDDKCLKKEQNWWTFYKTGKIPCYKLPSTKKVWPRKNQWYHPLKYLKKQECGPASACMQRIREFL
jgi:hypothetical protein